MQPRYKKQKHECHSINVCAAECLPGCAANAIPVALLHCCNAGPYGIVRVQYSTVLQNLVVLEPHLHGMVDAHACNSCSCHASFVPGDRRRPQQCTSQPQLAAQCQDPLCQLEEGEGAKCLMNDIPTALCAMISCSQVCVLIHSHGILVSVM